MTDARWIPPVPGLGSLWSCPTRPRLICLSRTSISRPSMSAHASYWRISHRRRWRISTTGTAARFQMLVGGHPYLVRRGLDVMVAEGLDIDMIEAQADREDGLYGSHLHQL